MSLLNIAEDYKKSSIDILDEKAFKAAVDTYKGEVDILYEIYRAQAACQRLVDIIHDVAQRLEDLEADLDMLEVGDDD